MKKLEIAPKANCNKFSILPDFIKKDKRLTGNAKLIYSELLRLSNNKGYAWPSYEYLALAVGCSRSQAIRCVEKLIELEYVIKEWSAYRSNRYFITHRLTFKSQAVSTGMSLAFYKDRRNAREKAAAKILKISLSSGLSKGQFIEDAVKQALSTT